MATPVASPFPFSPAPMDPQPVDLVWPPEFVCPISSNVLADPVIVASGQTYERRCIEAWLALGQNRCVTHGTPLEANFLIPNVGLKSAIANFVRARNLRAPEQPSVALAAVLARRRIAQEERRGKVKKQEDVQADKEEESLGLRRTSGGRNSAVEDRLREPRRGRESRWEDGDGLREKVANESTRETQGSEDAAGRRAGKSMRSGRGGGEVVQAMERLRVSGDEEEESGGGGSCSYGGRGSVGLSGGDGGLRAGYGRGGEGSSSGYGGGRRVGLERYAHSASVQALSDAEGGRRAGYGGEQELPLPLATTPASYSAMEENSAAGVALLPPSSPFEALLTDLQSSMAVEQEAAAFQIRQLARSSTENRLALCRLDIVHALLPLFKSPHASVQVNSAAALVNLSLAKENKVMIVRAGAVPPLVDVLHCGSPEAQEHAAGAIFSLSLSDENKTPIAVLDALPPLLRILHFGPPGARQDAAMALYHLSFSRSNRSKLVKLDAVPILLDLAQTKDALDLACRSLLILCNIAAVPDGRGALLEFSAIPMLVKLLSLRASEKSSNRNAAEIPEHAAAVLLPLSKDNHRFKSIATNAGALELLAALADQGTPRAQEKARALLAILRESPPDSESTLHREYLRRTWGRTDGETKSSAF